MAQVVSITVEIRTEFLKNHFFTFKKLDVSSVFKEKQFYYIHTFKHSLFPPYLLQYLISEELSKFNISESSLPTYSFIAIFISSPLFY